MFQLVYISNCLYLRSNFFYLATRSAGWVTGGWQYYEPDYDYSSVLTARLQISKYFIENTIVFQGIYLTAAFLWIIFFVIYTCQQEEGSRSTLKTFLYKVVIAVYQYLVFPLTAAFILIMIITVYVNNSPSVPSQPKLGSIQISSLCQEIVMVLLSCVLAPESIGLGSKNSFLKSVIGVKMAKNWYPRIFILRSFIIGLFIQIGEGIGSFELIRYVIVTLMLLYLVGLALYPPYEGYFSNIGVFICNLTSLFTLALPIIFGLVTF